MAIEFQRILEENVPKSVLSDSVIFTEQGNIYVNDNSGNLIKCGGGGQGAPTKVTWPSARPKRKQEYEFIESTFTIGYDIFLHHIGVPAYDTYDGCTLQIHSEIAGTTKEYVLEGNSFNINERQLFGDTLTIRILNNSNGIPYAEATPICGAGMTYVTSVFGDYGEFSAWSVGIVIHYS